MKTKTKQTSSKVKANSASTKKTARDVEKSYSRAEVVKKLIRLTEAISNGKSFNIQIANKRISVPKTALVSLEHESDGKSHEIEFQLKWKQD